MKYIIMAAVTALISADAYGLEGKITNKIGEPIKGAKIEIEAQKKPVFTNKQGQFEISGDVEELHITAEGYSHKIIHLHDISKQHTSQVLQIILSTTVIEQIDVIGLPIHASLIESALPIAVLEGKTLRNQQASTLGDSLERLPGVTTNFHGNVASTPVIRGLSGPRVLITQNSLDVSDVSRVGPDHSVSSEVSTAQQIEVLRGPATLFYGSGAIGGVVNVVDQRVPTSNDTKGEVSINHKTVNKQNQGSFNITSGKNNWGFYTDGFWRDSEDYEIPAPAELNSHDEDHAEEHSDRYTVENSSEKSRGFTLGSSYLMDNGFVGVAAERLDRKYGIPGHTHGNHEEETTDTPVYADLQQDRYQIQSEIALDSSWLHTINARAAYTDYAHSEIEKGEVETFLSKQTSELRLDIMHQEWQHWKGGITAHYKLSDADGRGDEAFTPASTSETFALAIMEERHLGKVLLQIGARAERVLIEADNVLLPPLEIHEHDTIHTEEEEHEEDHSNEEIHVFSVENEFTPLSLSLGAVWDYSPGYNIGLALSHADRAPSASELLAFGPHIGTRSYEVGALFALHDDEDEMHFEISNIDFELETSNNIDLTFRKHEGDVGIILNAFLNKIDNYYYQQSTELYAESAHSHEEESEHTDELPIYLFTYGAAEFYGLEGQVIWRVNKHWQTTLFSDFVHAELENGSYLPRTPPMRLGADLEFTAKKMSANFSWIHYTKQNKTAHLETPTASYNLLNATITYQLPISKSQLSIYLKAENLSDTNARVHSSFIKDIAPRPGRSFSLGIRSNF